MACIILITFGSEFWDEIFRFHKICLRTRFFSFQQKTRTICEYDTGEHDFTRRVKKIFWV